MKNLQTLSVCLLSFFTFCLMNNVQASNLNMCNSCGGTCGGHQSEANKEIENLITGKCACGCKKKPLHH